MLSVYSAGRIPGGCVTNHIYTWVDPQGLSASPPSGLPQAPGSALRPREGDSRSTLSLLQGGDEKKVSCPLSAPAGGPLETPFSRPDPDQGSSQRLDTGAWLSRASVLSQAPAEGCHLVLFSFGPVQCIF